MWRYIMFISAISALAQGTGNNYRIINTAQGRVRGHLEPENGVYAFYNIPYASAPTGTNRFKPPYPPPVWMHTFDAVDRGIICPQPGSHLNIQEDCLVANVFVPIENETNLSVAVVVHGGAYQIGFGNHQTLNTLVRSNKLIVVTFNYRLGAHGFLCLGTKDVPGNAGLKDQVALLRWVNINIASFGGNNEDVTLIGCSAGGGSVDALTLSAITTGLFHKAIVDSGAVFGAVGIQAESIVKAQNYAKLLNFNNVTDIEALEEFYKTISFQKLYSQHDMVSGNTDSTILFSPCLERDIGEERVLTEPPINVIKKGNYNKIPLIYGFSNMEGLIRLSLFETWKSKMNENFADFLPGELHFESKEIKEEVAETVKKFYFDIDPVGEANILSYINFFTDVLFAYPMLKALRLRVESQSDTIYLLEYSFVDENTPSIPHTEEKGANHCDQSDAVFDQHETDITEEYRQIKAVMQEYWINFILTGSPSVPGSTLPVWAPANANRAPYMSFGTAITLNSSVLLEKRVILWDSIYDQYYRGPMSPPPDPGASGCLGIPYIMISLSLVTLYLTL